MPERERGQRAIKDVGGTPGGCGPFLLGMILTTLGGYLLMNQITVHGGYWRVGPWGVDHTFGATVLLFMLGVALLFYDGSSWPGWILFGGSILFGLVGVILNLQVSFRATSLYVTGIMFGSLAAGLGLVARSMFRFEKMLAAEEPPEVPPPTAWKDF